MLNYSYVKCKDLTQAYDLLEKEEQVYPLAGGTDLIVGMRGGKFAAKIIVDIKDLPELKILEENDQGIVIGAAVTLNEIATFKPIIDHALVLAEGAHTVGSYPIRNRATLAGNICNASPAADTAAPLMVLNAQVKITGSHGKRTVSINEFFVGPGQNVLKKGELVESVLIPRPYPNGTGVYLKASRTGSVDLATVGVAVQSWDNKVQVAVGAVAATPVRAISVEKAVNENGEKDLARAASLARDDISPITDLRGSREYRYHMAEVLIRRGIEKVMEV